MSKTCNHMTVSTAFDYSGKFPVVNISYKDDCGGDFESEYTTDDPDTSTEDILKIGIKDLYEYIDSLVEEEGDCTCDQCACEADYSKEIAALKEQVNKLAAENRALKANKQEKYRKAYNDQVLKYFFSRY